MTQLFTASFDGLPLPPPPTVSTHTHAHSHHLPLHLLQPTASSCSSLRQQRKHTGSKRAAVQCIDSALHPSSGSHLAAEPHLR